jgi:hypothetical protein
MPDNAVIRTTIPGPWGPFHLAATDRGVVAVAWLTTEAAFDAELAQRLHVPVENARDIPASDPRRIHLDAGLAALEGLLAGRPIQRSIAFDLADRPAWDRRVLDFVFGFNLGFAPLVLRIHFGQPIGIGVPRPNNGNLVFNLSLIWRYQ